MTEIVRQLDTFIGLIYGAVITYYQSYSFALFTAIPILFLWMFLDGRKKKNDNA